MPHRLDCGLLHHAFRGRRGRSVGRRRRRRPRRHHALPFTQWVSGLLYSKAAAGSAACWLSCRKLMRPLAYWSWLARKGLPRLMRPHQERGWKREDGTSSPTHYRRPGAGTVCEADQYLDGSRSFHPCDHGKRNLAQASVTTTRISLSSRQPRLQCKAATISKSQPQQPF